MTAGILLGGQTQGDRVEFSAAGSWTAEYAGAIEPQVEAATRGVTARSIFINLTRIEYLDTYGAWLLERTMRNWTNQGRDARLIGLREDYRGLFEKVHAGTQKLTPPPSGPNSIVATLESIGITMAGVGADLALFAQMMGSIIVALKRVILRPTTFRFTSMIHQLERVGWRAVPIILLITVLIGAILAQQGIFHFRKFGADIYRHRYGRRAGAARSRRADRLRHGCRPFRQLLHGRARRRCACARKSMRCGPWVSTR